MTQKMLPIKPQSTSLAVPLDLLDDIVSMIDQARKTVAATVNMSLTMLNWRIGRRIKEEVLQGERGEYGQQIVASLARQLTLNYGKSFTDKNLRRMIQFVEVFPDEEIVVSLIRQLSWTILSL